MIKKIKKQHAGEIIERRKNLIDAGLQKIKDHPTWQKVLLNDSEMKTLFDEIEAVNKKITPETVEHYTRANVDYAWSLLEELKQRFENKSVYKPDEDGFSDEQIAHLEKIESIKENTKEKKYDAFRNECVLFFEKYTGKDLVSFSDSKKIMACIYLIQRKNGRQRFPLADITEYLESIRRSNNPNYSNVINGNRHEMHETLETVKEEDKTFLIRTLLEMTKSREKKPKKEIDS